MKVAVLVAVLLCQAAGGGQAPPPQDDEFQKRVDAAIEKGLKYLEGKFPGHNIANQTQVELVLLTLVHGGMREDHPLLLSNINKLLPRSLIQTYNVGLRALLLEKIDRKKYQRQLMEIAAFFVNSQLKHGQWEYSGKSTNPSPAVYRPTPSSRTRKKPPSGSTQVDEKDPVPAPPRKLPPQQRQTMFGEGDNSTTQYGVLGLFAAERANVIVHPDTWKLVEKWFEECQNKDGGWGYKRDKNKKDEGSSGSMTTAGLTGLIVSKYFLGKDWKNEESVKRGLRWLGGHLSYSGNPGGDDKWQYYYLYGLERVGMISGLETIGGRNWYREGAEYLLKNQAADGHWVGKTGDNVDDVVNTCFAILFLRKATPKLERPKKENKDVATGAKKK